VVAVMGRTLADARLLAAVLRIAYVVRWRCQTLPVALLATLPLSLAGLFIALLSMIAPLGVMALGQP